MGEVPLRLHEFPVPATKGVRREQVRQPLPSWSEPLENREHKPFFLTRLRVGDLAAQDNQLLAQYQQLEILERDDRHARSSSRSIWGRERVMRRTVTRTVSHPSE